MTITVNDGKKRENQNLRSFSTFQLHIQLQSTWNSNWTLSLFILSSASVNFPFVCFHLHRRSWVGRSKTSIPVGALLNHTQTSPSGYLFGILHLVLDKIISTFFELIQRKWSWIFFSKLLFMKWFSPRICCWILSVWCCTVEINKNAAAISQQNRNDMKNLVWMLDFRLNFFGLDFYWFYLRLATSNLLNVINSFIYHPSPLINPKSGI